MHAGHAPPTCRTPGACRAGQTSARWGWRCPRGRWPRPPQCAAWCPAAAPSPPAQTALLTVNTFVQRDKTHTAEVTGHFGHRTLRWLAPAPESSRPSIQKGEEHHKVSTGRLEGVWR
eukprot:6715606-Pyramimonas_sp.AAC.1